MRPDEIKVMGEYEWEQGGLKIVTAITQKAHEKEKWVRFVAMDGGLYDMTLAKFAERCVKKHER